MGLGEGQMLLAGKVAVISGAANARGIGFATARLFAAHGEGVGSIQEYLDRRERRAV